MNWKGEVGNRATISYITQAGDTKELIYSHGYENNESMAKLKHIS